MAMTCDATTSTCDTNKKEADEVSFFSVELQRFER